MDKFCAWSSDEPCRNAPDDPVYPWWCLRHGDEYRRGEIQSEALVREMLAEAESYVAEEVARPRDRR